VKSDGALAHFLHFYIIEYCRLEDNYLLIFGASCRDSFCLLL